MSQDNDALPQEELVSASGVKMSRRKMLATLGVAGLSLAAGASLFKSTAVAAPAGNILVYNVKDYPGTDTAAIQAAINECHTDGGGIVYFPPGTYLIEATIRLKSNVTLLGTGAASIIQAAPLLGDNIELILNENVSGAVDTYTDHHMNIYHLTFVGNSSLTRFNALVTLVKATEVEIAYCTFRNNTYMGVAMAGCSLINVRNCTFKELGRPKPSIYSAPALWTDKMGDGSYSRGIVVEQCLFIDNNWSGCYFMPRIGAIRDCTFYNNGESSIFTNGNGSDIQYCNNYIDGAKRSNISASGIECGASNCIISDNQIKNCENDGISLTDVKNVIVSDNIISNNGKDNTRFPTAAGIAIIAIDSSPSLQIDHIQIMNNRITDEQATKTQVYGICVGGRPGPTAKNLQIYNNDIADNKTAPMFIDATKWGDGCFTEGNTGHASAQPRMGQFTAPSSTGNYTVSGVGFKPRRIELRATLPGARVYESDAVFVMDAGYCQWRATLGSTSASGTETNKAVALYNQSSALRCAATLASRNLDGFTLNFSTVTDRPTVTWIAYP